MENKNNTYLKECIKSVAHNLHHKKFDGNYGLYLLFWDRLMGTLRKETGDVFESITKK